MSESKLQAGWEDEFRELKPSFESLKDEAIFTLEKGAQAKGIKTHWIGGRVKSIKSIGDKARKKDYSDPIAEVEDIIGVRVVVLFLSDLPRLDELIAESFEILDEEDKVVGGDPASFGYMSTHYLASLQDIHSGPRYDDLKGITFEIQARTIVMDAWANVSHYLDYKGESSIPETLRKDFYALSGLFYVADQHFELFSERASESQARAERELQMQLSTVVPIDLDTVAAFLAYRYPDREHSDRASISEFVEEIVEVGYENLAALAKALDRGEDSFLKYEATHPPDPDEDEEWDVEELLAADKYQDLGAARLSLAMADQSYSDAKYDGEFSA